MGISMFGQSLMAPGGSGTRQPVKAVHGRLLILRRSNKPVHMH